MQIHIANTIEQKFGGEGIAAHGLSKSISDQKLKVLLITRQIIGKRKSFEKKNTYYSIFFLSNDILPIQIIKDLFFINSIFNKYRPAIVHIHGLWTIFLSLAAFLCIFKKIKFIVSPHGCLEPWALNHKKIKKKIALLTYQKYILSKCNCLVVNSELENKNVQKLKIRVCIAIIANAIPYLPKRCNTFKEYSKKKSKDLKKLLFFSRIHEKKGVDYLLKSWSLCDTENWKLDIIGPGDPKYVDELSNLILKFDIKKNVNLKPGYVSNKVKTKYFKTADAFILPTKSENFGIVVIEAMSFQLPVITTKEAPWEEISKFKCGWWVDANIKAIASSIQSLINTSQKEMYLKGLRGYNLVKDNYTWSTKGVQAYELHNWLLDKKLKKPLFVSQNFSD